MNRIELGAEDYERLLSSIVPVVPQLSRRKQREKERLQIRIERHGRFRVPLNVHKREIKTLSNGSTAGCVVSTARTRSPNSP